MHVLAKVLTIHDGLGVSGRLPAIGRTDRRISTIELAALVGLGMVMAAVSTFMPRGLQLPGHNILCIISPWRWGWRPCRESAPLRSWAWALWRARPCFRVSDREVSAPARSPGCY